MGLSVLVGGSFGCPDSPRDPCLPNPLRLLWPLGVVGWLGERTEHGVERPGDVGVAVVGGELCALVSGGRVI